MFSVYANVKTPTQLITKAKVQIDIDAGTVRVCTNLRKELHNLTGTVTHLEKRHWEMVTDDGVTIDINGDGPGCQSCGGTKIRELA